MLYLIFINEDLLPFNRDFFRSDVSFSYVSDFSDDESNDVKFQLPKPKKKRVTQVWVEVQEFETREDTERETHLV